MKTTQHNEKHSHWKGDAAKYMSKHGWLYRNWGQPQRCDECCSTDKPRRYYHWANISDKYIRDRSDWKRLCALCHILFDKSKKGILKPQIKNCTNCNKDLPKYPDPITGKRYVTCSDGCYEERLRIGRIKSAEVRVAKAKSKLV